MNPRQYTKTVVVLQPQTLTQDAQSAVQFNNGWVGVRLDCEVTALSGTSPTATFAIEIYDEAAGTWVTEVTSAAVSAPGHVVLQVDPRVASVANEAVQRILPRRWRATVTLGGTNPAVDCSIAATYAP